MAETVVVKTTLTVEVVVGNGVPVVKCHGRLVMGAGEPLSRAVKELIPHHQRVVLDLTDLTHMDSMGLGLLVRLYVSGKSGGCEIQLVNLGKQVRNLLGTTHMLNVFTVIGEQGIKFGP